MPVLVKEVVLTITFNKPDDNDIRAKKSRNYAVAYTLRASPQVIKQAVHEKIMEFKNCGVTVEVGDLDVWFPPHRINTIEWTRIP